MSASLFVSGRITVCIAWRRSEFSTTIDERAGLVHVHRTREGFYDYRDDGQKHILLLLLLLCSRNESMYHEELQ